MSRIEKEERVPTLLYLAHLTWEHVWQRPQQLMTRFAERCRVIYVDPPEIVRGESLHLQERQGSEGVQVFRPIFPAPLKLLPGQEPGEAYQGLWLQLLPEALKLAGQDVVLWVSSPRADYLVEAVRPLLAVYDCMDDLAGFADGSEIMYQREERLMAACDLMFTGGYSMYMARKDKHQRVYCFPSGVDVSHYRQTSDPRLAEPKSLAGLPHPRLGYFGVLDERIDWPLIAEVAAARPEWQWVLVGPTAKIKKQNLPRAANIHYLGHQKYEKLPAFLKGFDVATMPFALNRATRYISPTKTLEYLAGGKSVLSTSVPDVAATYKDIAYIADGAAAWLEEVPRILGASAEERAARQERAEAIIRESSWDSITTRMWELIQEQLATKQSR